MIHRSVKISFTVILQDLGNINTSVIAQTEVTSGRVSFECCKPMREEGYQSLLISSSGGLFSLPLAYGFVAFLRQRLPIAQFVTFLLTGILVFVQV